MEKTVVELFAGVGGFRCGLNKVELINFVIVIVLPPSNIFY